MSIYRLIDQQDRLLRGAVKRAEKLDLRYEQDFRDAWDRAEYKLLEARRAGEAACMPDVEDRVRTVLKMVKAAEKGKPGR
ncbi:hypothetical protein ATK36_0469 [Amycolatopsis sulphurea]|uniref:Uncharacterized protein n=1 Tax=Amycolatopsis sulphurea TaxID=76022 RepID=A0A2A9G189_9PSEU|nr:hypothetical protein [Amycolatopsis sulphurea]PFG56933.1 hypothetical protein ATK36_0469 [Amycolatopsis sulphurea]